MKIKKKYTILEQRIKYKISIPNGIMILYKIFKKNNYKLFIVGGAVRDTLLKNKIKDYDLATDANPDIVEKLLKINDIKTLATGKSFGVINAFVNDEEYEIATFRVDLGKGRRPDSVSFSNIENDVLRRDLTINALFYDIGKEEIVDLVGGINDIKNGIIRTVGNAENRFDEDRLRILRAIRFSGRIGSKLDDKIDESLKRNNSLDGISKERIYDEFTKGISSAKYQPYFMGLIEKYNLFTEILPNIYPINNNYVNSNNVSVVISALLRDVDVKSIGGKLNILKYPSWIINDIIFLINYYKNFNESTFYGMKNKFENQHINSNSLKEFGIVMNLDENIINKFLDFKLTINGDDIMRNYNIPQGKGVYNLKKKIETELFMETL